MVKRKVAIILILFSLALTGCGKNDEKEELRVSGARSALTIMHIVSKENVKIDRPSAIIGIYSALFASQGTFLPVTSAAIGIKAASKVLSGQGNTETSETFALLQEVGMVLQVNIIDQLNRSTDRVKFLDEYLQSLRNAGSIVERKLIELEAQSDSLSDTRKAQRKEVRDVQRKLRTAMKDQNYSDAALLEEELAEKSGILAETEIREKSTEDVIDRYEALRDIAAKKLQAVSNNREILIAGLKVIEVPGIEDLRILEEGSKWRKNKGESIFQKSR